MSTVAHGVKHVPTLSPSRSLSLVQRGRLRQTLHQDYSPLEVTDFHPLPSKHIPHVFVVLSYHILIQEFGDCVPFSSMLPSYAHLGSTLSLAAHKFQFLNEGALVERMSGGAKFSLILFSLSLHSHFVFSLRTIHANLTCPKKRIKAERGYVPDPLMQPIMSAT